MSQQAEPGSCMGMIGGKAAVKGILMKKVDDRWRAINDQVNEAGITKILTWLYNQRDERKAALEAGVKDQLEGIDVYCDASFLSDETNVFMIEQAALTQILCAPRSQWSIPSLIMQQLPTSITFKKSTLPTYCSPNL